MKNFKRNIYRLSEEIPATTTAAPSFLYLGTDDVYPTASEACSNQVCSQSYYLPAPTIYIGQEVYNDSGLTAIYVGGNKWIAISENCNGTYTAIQVNNTGNIIAIASCISPTTTTTSTSTTTTTTSTTTTTTTAAPASIYIATGTPICRSTGNCNDNATCGIIFPVNITGAPVGYYVEASTVASSGATAMYTPTQVEYTETNASGTVTIRLELYDYFGGTMIAFTEQTITHQASYPFVTACSGNTTTTTTTTSTTTAAPTTTTSTTTTTTPPAQCFEYLLSTNTNAGANYTDCGGNPQSVSIGGTSGYDSTTLCALDGTVVTNGDATLNVTGVCPEETTTTTTTTTSTTTSAPSQGNISVYNLNSPGANAYLNNVQVDGTDIIVPLGTFPLSPGASAIGVYAGTSFSTIVVFSSHGADTPVRVSTSAGYNQCQVSSGYVEFTGVDLSTDPSISVTLDQEGSGCI
jgi:hypothetical protein